jgi:hypothetical protein
MTPTLKPTRLESHFGTINVTPFQGLWAEYCLLCGAVEDLFSAINECGDPIIDVRVQNALTKLKEQVNKV